MTTYEQSVYGRACKKIQRIIFREGTADGQRLQSWYLEQIEEEIRMSDKASALTLLESQLGKEMLNDVS